MDSLDLKHCLGLRFGQQSTYFRTKKSERPSESTIYQSSQLRPRQYIPRAVSQLFYLAKERPELAVPSPALLDTGAISVQDVLCFGDTNGYIDQSPSVNSGQLGRVVDL